MLTNTYYSLKETIIAKLLKVLNNSLIVLMILYTKKIRLIHINEKSVNISLTHNLVVILMLTIYSERH